MNKILKALGYTLVFFACLAAFTGFIFLLSALSFKWSLIICGVVLFGLVFYAAYKIETDE
jgi:hypothetical protein